MEHPDHFFLGRIVRTHGVKGDLIMLMDTDSPGNYKKLELIYVDIDGVLKEYDITKITVKEKENLATFHLSGIEDKTTAETYVKNALFLPLSNLPKLRGKKFYFHEVIGFTLIDKEKGVLGMLTNVYDLPQHPVGGFMYKEKEVLFPLMDQFIQKIDREEKILHIILPEGLLEIYD
ncbi:ribosome maturation factor RimM [soil metagenome]